MARKRSIKYFVYSLLLLQLNGNGIDIAVNVPFLTTAARKSIYELLAALQEQVLILEILAGKGLVQCVLIIP